MNARHSFHSRAWLPGLIVLGLMACMQVGDAQTAPPFTTLYNFGGGDGSTPEAGLIQGADGNLYGTALDGANGTGTVFQITTSGALTTLYNFAPCYPVNLANTDGANPWSALLQGSDGNLYGTTRYGSPNSVGTVFRMTTAGVLTTLHSFSATSGGLNIGTNSDGAEPMSSLLQASDGNFYGTTEGGGGAYGQGTVFKLTMIPVTTDFSPTAGLVGTAVTLTGANFTHAKSVKFGKLAARFTINSDSSLTFTVPSPGAASAKIVVVNPFGKGVSSTAFTMAPLITGFSPVRGPVGTSVTLTGVNFTNTKLVKIGKVSVNFTVNSDTSLTFVVPKGALSAHVSVINPYGARTSSTAFTVTH